MLLYYDQEEQAFIGIYIAFDTPTELYMVKEYMRKNIKKLHKDVYNGHIDEIKLKIFLIFAKCIFIRHNAIQATKNNTHYQLVFETITDNEIVIKRDKLVYAESLDQFRYYEHKIIFAYNNKIYLFNPLLFANNVPLCVADVTKYNIPHFSNTEYNVHISKFIPKHKTPTLEQISKVKAYDLVYFSHIKPQSNPNIIPKLHYTYCRIKDFYDKVVSRVV